VGFTLSSLTSTCLIHIFVTLLHEYTSVVSWRIEIHFLLRNVTWRRLWTIAVAGLQRLWIVTIARLRLWIIAVTRLRLWVIAITRLRLWDVAGMINSCGLNGISGHLRAVANSVSMRLTEDELFAEVYVALVHYPEEPNCEPHHDQVDS